jgi:hypothetical protein
MKKDRYIRITNLNLATFLYTNNHLISGVHPLNGDQKEFAFLKTDPLEELIWLYKFGDKDDDRLLVNVHLYERARRELLDRLND